MVNQTISDPHHLELDIQGLFILSKALRTSQLHRVVSALTALSTILPEPPLSNIQKSTTIYTSMRVAFSKATPCGSLMTLTYATCCFAGLLQAHADKILTPLEMYVL